MTGRMTPRDRALFTRMWNQGLHTDIIADTFGVTQKKVTSIRTALNLTPRTVRSHYTTKRRDFSDEEIAQIRELKKTKSITELATLFNVSQSSMREKLMLWKIDTSLPDAPVVLSLEAIRRQHGALPLPAGHPIAMEVLNSARFINLED